MRNAAAALDDDFGYDAPASRRASRKPRSAAPGKKKNKGKRFSWDGVARYGAIGISATVAVGIMVNALMMQKGRHPAPLFGKGLAPHGDMAAAAMVPSAAPKPAQTPPAAADGQPASALDDGATAAASKPRRSASAQPDADTSGADPIARLLNGPKASASTAEKGDGKTVLGAQKALNKLGFVVKANGAMGATTRKAIEEFEKDRHLPVKGELSRRLVKVLAAESGVHID